MRVRPRQKCFPFHNVQQLSQHYTFSEKKKTNKNKLGEKQANKI